MEILVENTESNEEEVSQNPSNTERVDLIDSPSPKKHQEQDSQTQQQNKLIDDVFDIEILTNPDHVLFSVGLAGSWQYDLYSATDTSCFK